MDHQIDLDIEVSQRLLIKIARHLLQAKNNYTLII